MRERDLTRHNQQEAAANRWNRNVGIGLTAGVLAAAAAAGAGIVHHHEQSTENHRPIGDVNAQHVVLNPKEMLSEQLQSNPKALAMAEQIQKAMAHRAASVAGRIMNEYQHPENAPHSVHVDVEYDYEPGTDHKQSATLKEVNDGDDQPGNIHSVTFGMKGDHIDQSDIWQVRNSRGGFGGNPDDTSKITTQTMYPTGEGTWAYYGTPAAQGVYEGEGYGFKTPGEITSIPQLEEVQQLTQNNLNTNI